MVNPADDPPELEVSVGEWIRRMREFSGLSQEALAAKLKAAGLRTGRSRISTWESGINVPRGDTLMVVRRLLNEAAKQRPSPPEPLP